MKNRSRIALLVASLFMLGTGSITAYQSLSKTIAIVDDGKVTQYETLDVYVEELIQAQGIELNEKDEVTPSLDTQIENGMKITIDRWKPIVDLNINGNVTTFETESNTVGELLTERQIELAEGSVVEPALETPITDALEIKVKTKQIVTEVIEEEIPFETIVKETPNLEPGEEQVTIEGKNGLKEKTVEIVQFGGEIVSETVKEEVVIIESQSQLIKRGSKNIVVDQKTGKTYQYARELTMNATAYTHQPGDPWYNKTASGMPTFVGMVAVDRNVIPLGTILYVDGYGIAIAGDVGGAINGHDIDLYFNSPNQVTQFGRQNKKVYVLKDQSIDVQKERGHK
ncbi:MAG: 3D domain-containing protein [Cellulosilyticaceae bacterium]